MRFGPRQSGQSVHPTGIGRAGGAYPNNMGAGTNAQMEADRLAAASARRQREAITGVDAVNLFLWQPKTSGLTCSCRGGLPSSDTHSDPTILGVRAGTEPSIRDPGNIGVVAYDVSPTYQHTELRPHTVASTEPAHRFGFNDDPDDDNVQLSVFDATSATDVHGYSTQQYGGGPTTGAGNEARHEFPPNDFTEELISEFEADEAWDAASIVANNSYLTAAAQSSACAICYNTGIVGGYDLWGGTHLVLESVAEPAVSNGFVEDPTYTPPVYTIDPDGYMLWQTSLPSHFDVLWTSVRHKRAATAGFVMAYSIDGQTFVSDLASISTQALDTLYVRVTNPTDAPLQMTHVVIAVQHLKLRGQVTNLTLPAGRNTTFNADPITITLPADTGLIDRNSIIADSKYRLVWRAQSIESIMDSRMRLTSQTVSTKLVLVSEVEASIYPDFHWRHSPQKLYMGIEPKQGSR